MRLWSLHPKYLDRQGLLAVWREGLLAQKVLQGRTKGYRQHPQLDRFKAQRDPVAAIASYLRVIQMEATRRGYSFAASKIAAGTARSRIKCTRGQFTFEIEHLTRKLRDRDQKSFEEFKRLKKPFPHPLFILMPGSVENWERGQQT